MNDATTPAAGVKVDGLTHLHVRTRHPQDYVLHNEQDGTRWRGTAAGRWVRDDAGVAVAPAPSITDDMAMAFHRATSDGSIGQEEVEDIKRGLRAVFDACGVEGRTNG